MPPAPCWCKGLLASYLMLVYTSFRMTAAASGLPTHVPIAHPKCLLTNVTGTSDMQELVHVLRLWADRSRENAYHDRKISYGELDLYDLHCWVSENGKQDWKHRCSSTWQSSLGFCRAHRTVMPHKLRSVHMEQKVSYSMLSGLPSRQQSSRAAGRSRYLCLCWRYIARG
jgi:hypothetical protein